MYSLNGFLFYATRSHSLATCFGHFRLSLQSWSSKLQNVQTCSATLPSDPRFSLYHIVTECAVKYHRVLIIWYNKPGIPVLRCCTVYFCTLWFFVLELARNRLERYERCSKLFIYKTSICTTNIRNITVLCILLHVSLEVYAPIFNLSTYWLCDAPTSLTFNNCTFYPHNIDVFCIYLRTNNDLYHLQHKVNGFYNRVEKCLLRGTNWVFK